MNRLKPVSKFFLCFIFCYSILLVAGALNEEFYESRFRAFGKYFFEDFRGKGIVVFDKLDKAEEKHFNTVMKLTSKQQYEAFKKSGAPYKISSVTVSGWYTGFLPTILVIALIFSAPFIGVKRKLIALLWALLLIQLFVWVQLYIQILYEFNRNDILQVVSFSPFWQKVMDAFYYLFVKSMGLKFIIPVFIWILVTFRKDDLENLLKPAVSKK